jgi:hypothetical protein
MKCVRPPRDDDDGTSWMLHKLAGLADVVRKRLSCASHMFSPLATLRMLSWLSSVSQPRELATAAVQSFTSEVSSSV